MQWTGFPVPVELPVPPTLPTTTMNQAMTASRFEPCLGGCVPEKNSVPHRDSNHANAASGDAVLQALAPMDRSQLYDLADLLLSELIPGWSDDRGEEYDDDEDDDEDYGVDEEDEYMDVYEAPVVEAPVRGAADPVVDASYRACIREAERFLVQCEGFDANGSVVSGLRQHLHLARVEAAGGAGGGGQPRQRPPGGCP